MKVDIQDILYNVEKPARYLGNEINSIHKEIDEKTIRYAFCFPDVYEIGMSHLGMQIMYHLLNSKDNIFCERVFAPALDMEEQMRKNKIPLFGLESRQALDKFDFIGFTLQYELSYTNILNMLDMANIPLYSSERKSRDPIIMVGGPCAYNPEPIADFVDIVILGEGEEVTLELMELYEQEKKLNYSKEAFLEKAALIRGVYVPSLYKVSYTEEGCISEFKPLKDSIPTQIKKRIIHDLDNVYYPEALIVPYLDVVHNRIMLEIFRGCMRGCRFCQAGMIYRPVREKSVDKLTELTKKLIDSTGYEEISLASLSTSDFTQLEEIVRHLIDTYSKDKVGISLPSLRLDNFSLEIIKEIQKVRKTGLTFAPEAGSQRLRDVINKGLTEEDLVNAVEKAFASGWSNVKLYFMMGLPTETDIDLLGIKQMAQKVLEVFKNTPKEVRAKSINVTVSTSTFVPKPFTPFQWEPQISQEEISRRQALLSDELKIKNVKYNYHDSQTSFLEAIFARGDRRLSKVLEAAYRLGCKFDGWGEHFNYSKWMEAFESVNLDPDFYIRKRSYEEILPWDHISVGVTKKFLIKENERAKEEKLTENCRKSCSACGINQNFTGGVC
ncbi:TIGR03960 family B12-binding radical SAM protein [Serpentinicella sp. ANB-PHB4]|uniref:TIGR03960 family B12-binding radical SAM protein n=1 Tax=Serpentinicella sp. ANB-PHB4 TaxID=3074076 RepID=UPI00285A7870|nr:TIGR03960 family B12-binding radical SAM protein [Serpentinicella sp. ANB-PHB4]MDR5657896.1 TIGR03960 family B12-binding radical SAM protein [Serpentinicella sp. ANB-PHB4]